MIRIIKDGDRDHSNDKRMVIVIRIIKDGDRDHSNDRWLLM